MRIKANSEIIELAISAMTETDMASLLKQAEDDCEEKIAMSGDERFTVPNFQVVSVDTVKRTAIEDQAGEREHVCDNIYTVIYNSDEFVGFPRESMFLKAPIISKGYEPVKVDKQDDQFVITFERTDWQLQN